jgi:hypothetical protein
VSQISERRRLIKALNAFWGKMRRHLAMSLTDFDDSTAMLYSPDLKRKT